MRRSFNSDFLYIIGGRHYLLNDIKKWYPDSTLLIGKTCWCLRQALRDTILKKYSSTVATIFTGVASAALFGHTLTINFILGISVVFISMHQSKRENTQPCFPCTGSGAQKCKFCMGDGTVTVELGGNEKEVSKCINCDSAGSLTCTTCQGTGIQPRYLDRREFKDDD